MPLILIISYDGTEKDRFDREYYCKHHIPHVCRAWKPFGLLDIRPFFPGFENSIKGTVCICQCIFKDKTAMDTAFAAPVTKELMDDIPNFTELPIQMGILTSLEK